jgi:hypothetical protein
MYIDIFNECCKFTLSFYLFQENLKLLVTKTNQF